MSSYWVVPVHSPQSLSKICHLYLLVIMETKFSFPDMLEDERRRGDRLFAFAENLCIKGKY